MTPHLIDPKALSHSLASTCRQILADRVLMICMVLAILLHALLIFGLSFVAPGGDRAVMQEVSIAVHISQTPDPKADFLAQANQQGSGVLRNVHRMTSPDERADAATEQQAPTQQASTAQAAQQAMTPESRVLTTTLSFRHQSQATEHKTTQQQVTSLSSETAIEAKMAALEAQYAKRKQEYSRKTQIHTIDSISAKADSSAAYLDQFRQKVERVGNRHYPDEARARQLHGDVRLMVILTPDGAIRAIRLLESSGHRVLDEAAKASVRDAAPYPKFGANMKDYSELRIIRTWRFSEKLEAMDVAQ